MCAGAIFDRLVFKESKPRSLPIAISDAIARTARWDLDRPRSK